MQTSEKQNAQWCRNLFAMLNDGGVWAVPRSGLVFRKQDGALVLQARLAGTFPVDQATDFDCIRSHFEAAGIKVKDHASA